MMDLQGTSSNEAYICSNGMTFLQITFLIYISPRWSPRRSPGNAFPMRTEIISIAVSRHVIPRSHVYTKYDNNPACYINM